MAPSHGAAWRNAAAKVAGAGLSFVLLIVLARTMTPEAFADISVIFAWLALAIALACLSMPLIVVRFVAENLAANRADLARGVVQFSIATTVGTSLVLSMLFSAAVLSGLIVLPRDLAESTVVAAVLLVLGVLLQVLSGLMQGLKRVVAAEMLVNVLRPALMLVALAWLWFIGLTPVSATTALIVYLVTTMLLVFVCFGYSLSSLPVEMARARPAYAYRMWLRTASGFMGVMIAAAVNERIDILVIGLVAPAPEVAVYTVAARLAQTVILATNAVAAVMAPHLVEKLADLRAGRLTEVQALVRATARTTLYVSVLALFGFWALAPLLLSLFGPHYETAYLPLLILLTGLMFSAFFGPAHLVATLAGAPQIAVFSLIGGIVINASLNVTLVPTLNANGAAIATATGTVAASMFAWAWTRRQFSLDTSMVGNMRRRTDG